MRSGLKFRRPANRYPAFTIVELLVVIAIIGILIAMLMPAINNSREAVRRVQCMNNLKQVGLATSQYWDLYHFYPYVDITGGWNFRVAPGEKSPDDRSAQPEKWGVQPIYDSKNLLKSPGTWVCPSEPEFMQRFKNTYAFSTADNLKDRFIADKRNKPFIWCNFNFKPYLSGFYRVKTERADNYSIAEADRVWPHGPSLRGYNRVCLDGHVEFFRVGN